MQTDFRASNGFYKHKEAVNKRILFPIDRNSDSISQNEGFAKYVSTNSKKLLSPAEISKKTVKDGFK